MWKENGKALEMCSKYNIFLDVKRNNMTWLSGSRAQPRLDRISIDKNLFQDKYWLLSRLDKFSVFSAHVYSLHPPSSCYIYVQF